MIKTAQTPSLTICYEEAGSASGYPVLLLHGSDGKPAACIRSAGPAPRPPSSAGRRKKNEGKHSSQAKCSEEIEQVILLMGKDAL
jgi:hypothetical protein